MRRHFLNSKTQPPLVFPVTVGIPPPSPTSQQPGRLLNSLSTTPMLPTWNHFPNSMASSSWISWIHSLSFVSISSAIALAPIICFLDQNTCFLTEFSASFYWFPSRPLCLPLPKLFLYCINQYISLHCLKPFVGLYLLSWKWYELHFLVCEAFMVCLLTTHPSFISWHVFLTFHLRQYIIVT